ncbi:N-acetylneuraminate synthase family protein, partial [Candidatus Pacearchaeota archaeon]|nr:N-acetylneuraminate synthase family protein [Candidatus Pacearchaeota archaeon]
YLRKIGGLRKKIILSTGMAELEEIRAALDILVEGGTAKENITLLHCNTQYPTPMEDVNLRAMVTLRETFGVETGYSDHTRGIEVSLAAVALGASVIEKHFTLDRDMEGPDHKASLEPDELKTLVTSIRNIEIALGDGVKKPSASELKNMPIARKSIVAAEAIRAGDVFTEKNITTKRPGTGISPMEWDRIPGQKAKRDFRKDEPIEL